MSGPQFVHIQTWSRKRNKRNQSIESVIAELNRVPQFSAHVADPKPPRPLFGDSAEFAAAHAAHVAARSTVARMSDGRKRVRSIRSDRHTMASIVMSYPVPRSKITTDEQKGALARWEKRNLQWLEKKYGKQLCVVAAHDDEEFPHLHAWMLPDDPGADATTLHPGKVAKKAAEAEAKKNKLPPREVVKLGNRALKEAMTEWQDEYYAEVGAPLGLTRSGPKRRRLSREQWKAEKATARAHAEALERATEQNLSSQQMLAEALAERKEARRILLGAQRNRDIIAKRETDVIAREKSLIADQDAATRAWSKIASENNELDAKRSQLEDFRLELVERETVLSRFASLVHDTMAAAADELGFSLPPGFSDAIIQFTSSIDEKIRSKFQVEDLDRECPEYAGDEIPGGPGF